MLMRELKHGVHCEVVCQTPDGAGIEPAPRGLRGEDRARAARQLQAAAL